jgi:hypothetical protein
MDELDSIPDIALLDTWTPQCSRRSSVNISRKTSWGTPIPPPSSLQGPRGSFEGDEFEDVDLKIMPDASTDTGPAAKWNTLDSIDALGLLFGPEESQARELTQPERFSLEDPDMIGNRSLTLEHERPFSKWISHLQKKATRRRKTVSNVPEASGLKGGFDPSGDYGSIRHKSHRLDLPLDS